MCLVRGLACFIGPPLGGIIKDATGSYDATFITGGCVYIIAGLICCLLHLPSISRVRFLTKENEAEDEQEETSA
jgi:MFS family permease